MLAFEKLISIQKTNNTRLCIGLDPQIEKIPKGLAKDTLGILEFNKIIINCTWKFVCAYKINFAFYEQFGSKGIEIIEKTLEIIPKNIVTIADGKRADIGNTSKAYAKAFYEHFKFDCATLNPFLGIDSLEPFFEYPDKLNFVLICTSNPGASDFQKLEINDAKLYEIILKRLLARFDQSNLGFVVGATNEKEFSLIRDQTNEHFILLPGIGTQGGNLGKILFLNNNKNLIVNVSRDIIFASSEKDFEQKIIERTRFYYENLTLVDV
ncbi:MAG: orotidine-5'-phosphate decarboxylase [Ignavibacteria bacterium]|nr:orotidine-5'-phosphate decarboxylase [Ignavibacteria bacterium]